MNEKANASPAPSLKELEAAALLRISAMIKDSRTKPNLNAVYIAARLMALKAYEAQRKDVAGG